MWPIRATRNVNVRYSVATILHTICKIPLFALSFLLVLPRVLFNTPGTALDGSWQLALHMAFQQGFIYGRDFIFTYGPLGIIQTRLPVGGVQSIILASDLFVYGNVLGLGIWAFTRFRSCLVWVAITATAIIMSAALYFMELAIVLYLLSLFYLLLYINSASVALLLLASICSIIVFYVKLNLGLCAFVILIAGVVWRYFLGETLKKTLIHIGVATSILFLSTLIIPVDLPLYIRSSIEIASGYNEAMGLSIPEFQWLIKPALVIWTMFLLFGLFNVREVFKKSRFSFIYGATILSLFLLFKQSFVRADEHVYTIFEYAPVLALIVLLLSEKKWTSWTLMIGTIGVSAFVCWDRLWMDQPFRKLEDTQKYFSSIGGQEYIDRYKGDVPIAAQLPSEFVSTIGRNSVDIIPWDIAALFYNNLNYLPRPVIQSYSAYTPYLDSVSASKYLSDSGPQFVVFFYGCIDRRYCWFDETQTKIALMRSYEVIDNRGGKILLQKRQDTKQVRLETIEEGEGVIGEPIKVPLSEGPLIWTPQIRLTLSGTLQKVFFRPGKFRIQMTLTDGSKKRFPAISSILNGGVLVDRLVESTEDAARYFLGEQSELKRVDNLTVGTKENGHLSSRFSYKFSKLVLDKSK